VPSLRCVAGSRPSCRRFHQVIRRYILTSSHCRGPGQRGFAQAAFRVQKLVMLDWNSATVVKMPTKKKNTCGPAGSRPSRWAIYGADYT